VVSAGQKSVRRGSREASPYGFIPLHHYAIGGPFVTHGDQPRHVVLNDCQASPGDAVPMREHTLESRPRAVEQPQDSGVTSFRLSNLAKFSAGLPLLSVEPAFRFSQEGGTWLRSISIAPIPRGYWSTGAAYCALRRGALAPSPIGRNLSRTCSCLPVGPARAGACHPACYLELDASVAFLARADEMIA
jgi:hypothetical protein